MYYEEKIVDGVWCWRNSPKSEWMPCNNSMVVNLLRERDELRKENENLKSALNFTTMQRNELFDRLGKIASMAGNPDPAEACRLIIKECE